jgi:Ca2+-binding RTX toxin-like protein
MVLRIVIALSLFAGLALPGAASAAVVGRGGAEGSGLVYAAGPGERNQLTVTADGNGVTFEDSGADIDAEEPCVAAGAHRVTCPFGLPVALSVQLEDGDDSVSASGTVPGDGASFGFSGGSGDDVLDAGSWPASLVGGLGSDDLRGGPGSPFLDGLDVPVRDHRFHHTPRQAPAADTIACVAAPAGAFSGTTAAIDAQDSVSGPCGSLDRYSGNSVVVTGTPGKDNLFSGRGPSRVYGLAGDDFVGTTSGDRGYGGGGNDNMSGGGALFGGTGDDRLGATQASADRTRLFGGAGDDFITGSNAANRIVGGSGRDRISGRRGNDFIDVRDGMRDTVRCGTGTDIVAADKSDAVFRDCERVIHRVLPAGPPSPRPRPAARSPRCAISKARGSKVYARTSTTVVYGRGFRFYACRFEQGRPRRLIDEGGGIKVGRSGQVGVKIAGRYIAYATPGSGIGDEVDRVYVYDIVAGRQLIVEDTASFVSDLALKPNGSVAWIQGAVVYGRSGDAQDRQRMEVRKVSLTELQGNVLLDIGFGIDPMSLQLSADGSSITWKSGEATRTATLG